jgi:cell wall-associated NlpC family hydrolase
MKLIDANDVTLKKFLTIAMQPVGETVYVWGGAWNEADTGSGVAALTMGVSPNWKAFFEKQDRDYDFEKTLFMIHSGLDCSGFLGRAFFNLIPLVRAKTEAY